MRTSLHSSALPSKASLPSLTLDRQKTNSYLKIPCLRRQVLKQVSLFNILPETISDWRQYRGRFRQLLPRFVFYYTKILYQVKSISLWKRFTTSKWCPFYRRQTVADCPSPSNHSRAESALAPDSDGIAWYLSENAGDPLGWGWSQ